MDTPALNVNPFLGFLKLYIRELPDRLVPSDLYEKLKDIETVKELQDDEDVEKAKKIVKLVRELDCYLAHGF